MTFKLILVTAAITAGVFFAGNWKSDTEKAKISFNVKGPFGTVNGNFTGLQTEIQFDEKDLGSSSFSASIDAKTVSTGVGMRNKHLREKEEWFNTDKFPRISFHSKKIEKAANGFKVLGELTIKGIAKPVEIPFTFSPKDNTGLFKGQFTIKREDYKLGPEGGSTGSVVTIILEVPVKK
jgi:polyisoprenoid-binding protein YceI